MLRPLAALALLFTLIPGCADEATPTEGGGSSTKELSSGTPEDRSPAPGPSNPAQPGAPAETPGGIAPGHPSSPPSQPSYPPTASTNKGFGYTMGVVHNEQLTPGTVYTSCHGLPQGLDSPHAGSCNPYTGDSSCERALPILCVSKDGSPAPQGSFSYDFYHGWVGGKLAATAPVVGASLTSLEQADATCRQQLGEGFRMAEHHDANGGWGFVGWDGGVPAGTRLWTYINDQPGNCWNAQ